MVVDGTVFTYKFRNQNLVHAYSMNQSEHLV